MPHIGHTLQKVAADILARWKRSKGYDVFFLTGTDEYGLKLEQKAQKLGLKPKELCDKNAAEFKDAWNKLNIDYTRFIRTTEPSHKKIVQDFIETVNKKGDIYKGKYEGWYCLGCEAYITEKDLVNGNCPLHGRKPDWISEESYFFKLSKYKNKLLRLYKKHPEFIQPDSRRKEIISRLENDVLLDLSISRNTFKWGIPFPLDKKHVTYVWFDALINYISGIDYPKAKFKKYWPADYHLLGKDNAWFHTVIWPAMLFSAGIKPPKTVYVHGFLTVEGRKISKSIGNVIDPRDLVSRYGSDAVRYYLLRENTFEEDGNIKEAVLVQRNNSDLADSLGNLVSRSLTLIEKFSDGKVPKCKIDKIEDNLVSYSERPKKISALIKKLEKEVEEGKLDAYAGKNLVFSGEGNLVLKITNFAERTRATQLAAQSYLNKLQFHKALETIWQFISHVNQYVDAQKPWELAKAKVRTIRTPLLYTQDSFGSNINSLDYKTKDLDIVLYNLAESLRIIAALVWPFIPEAAEEIAKQLNLKEVPKLKDLKWGGLKQGSKIKKGNILFQKFEYTDISEEFLEKKVLIDKQIETEVKEGQISVCIAELAGLNVKTKTSKLEKLKKNILSQIDETKLNKVFDSYKYMFEKIDRHPAGVSPENLLKYVKETNQLPNINTVTDAYNLISLKTGLIMGVYDEKPMVGNICLKVADGTEKFVEIGKKEMQPIYSGEYVLADEENNVITKWLTKQSNLIKVKRGTRQAVLCVQGNKNISQKDVIKTAKEVCELITDICGGKYKLIYS